MRFRVILNNDLFLQPEFFSFFLFALKLLYFCNNIIAILQLVHKLQLLTCTQLGEMNISPAADYFGSGCLSHS